MDGVARYRAGSEANDVDALMQTLAPDAELISPISGRMVFCGRDDLRVLLSAIYGSITQLRWREQVGQSQVLQPHLRRPRPGLSCRRCVIWPRSPPAPQRPTSGRRPRAAARRGDDAHRVGGARASPASGRAPGGCESVPPRPRPAISRRTLGWRRSGAPPSPRRMTVPSAIWPRTGHPEARGG